MSSPSIIGLKHEPRILPWIIDSSYSGIAPALLDHLGCCGELKLLDCLASLRCRGRATRPSGGHHTQSHLQSASQAPPCSNKTVGWRLSKAPAAIKDQTTQACHGVGRSEATAKAKKPAKFGAVPHGRWRSRSRKLLRDASVTFPPPSGEWIPLPPSDTHRSCRSRSCTKTSGRSRTGGALSDPPATGARSRTDRAPLGPTLNANENRRYRALPIPRLHSLGPADLDRRRRRRPRCRRCLCASSNNGKAPPACL